MANTDVWFCGDLHGQFRVLLWLAQTRRPKSLVLLGDIEAHEPLHLIFAPILKHTEVWWIAGNHDVDNERFYDNLFGSLLADHNLHNRVVEIGGLRIGGLGGVFKKKIWVPPALPAYHSPEDFLGRCGQGNHWRGGLPLKQRAAIFGCDFYALAKLKADFLVLHEAPSCHPYGYEALDQLARATGVRRVFHGHHHDSLDYTATVETLGFETVGVRQRGIVNQEGEVIHPGDE